MNRQSSKIPHAALLAAALSFSCGGDDGSETYPVDAGLADAGELDSDGDEVPDAVDPSPDDTNVCGDSDGDGCDDCSGGAFDPANDGADSDSDGVCDACGTEVCTHNGVCVKDGEQVACDCDTAYAGDLCDACASGYQDFDDNGVCKAACTDATCSGNGTCDDASGTATCTCDAGFSGDDCSVNGCDGVTCGGAGTCSTASGAVACVCDDGYQDDDGDLTCEDVDECADNNGGCGDAAFTTCTNNDGAEPTCADIDECAVANGGCGAAEFYSCTNNAGAEPTCADVDECAVANGGCGDATFMACTNNAGAAPTCEAIYADCSAIKASDQTLASGAYFINPGGNGTVETYCEMTLHGGGWTLLLNQDINAANTPDENPEDGVVAGYRPLVEWRAGVNTASYVAGDYSLLNKLDDGEFANSSDAYAFLIDWPEDGTDFIRWEQDTNPFVAFGALSNQVSVPVSQGSPTFQGLGPGTSAALLDGGSGSNRWHAIGTRDALLGGIPAWSNSGPAFLVASRSRLWVRPSLPVSCKAILGADVDAPDGTYTIDPDGPTGASPVAVHCDMTTDGGGWTRCSRIDEAGVGNQCVEEGGYVDDADLVNESFCVQFFTDTAPGEMRLDNRTLGDDTYGEGDTLFVDWSDDPIVPNTYDNKAVECQILDADGFTVTDIPNCQYASHEGTWQNASWSFTDGVANGYFSNFTSRVVLGPTYSVCGTNSWHNFGVGTNTENVANTWSDAENVGELYLR